MKKLDGHRWAVVSLLTAFLLPASGALALEADTDAVDVRHDAVVRAVEQVMPSVVNIATKTIVRVRDPFEDFFRQFYGRRPSESLIELGSGVIVDEEGYLLTNDHVVRRADEIFVQFNSGTNLYYGAKIVARDEKRDIALLKLDAQKGEKFHAIKFARDDDLLLGETVLAMGNPYGLGGTVSRGILSSKSRTMPQEGEQLDVWNWLQTDAPINRGNSGGPLVNLRGELIGINVAVWSGAQGIGFAIPIRLVEEALSDILPTEFVRSYWFGARVKVGTSPLIITSVQSESPAGRAGLKPGDAVLEVNGAPPRSVIDFADRLAAGADSTVTLAIQRGSERREYPVKLVPEKTVFNAEMIRKRLGLGLTELSAKDLLQRYRLNGPGACAITSVEEDGPADRANLQTGMLITSFDEETLTDLTAFAKRLYAKKKGEPLTLGIVAWQQAGNLSLLRQGGIELAPR